MARVKHKWIATQDVYRIDNPDLVAQFDAGHKEGEVVKINTGKKGSIPITVRFERKEGDCLVLRRVFWGRA